MKRTAQYIILCTLSLCTFSCRPTGDDLISYGQNDFIAFYESSSSYAGEFKAFWTAMNENYGIWDYEEEKGLDWDKVYTAYLPKFEALDDTTRKIKVTDDDLKDLYCEFLDSLHDGHTYLQIKNIQTDKYVEIIPSANRNERERGAAFKNEKDNITNLDFYRTLTEDDLYGALAYDATGSRLIIAEVIDSTCSRLIRGAEAYIAGVNKAGGPNEFNDSIYIAMTKLVPAAKKLQKSIADSMDSSDEVKELVKTYHTFCSENNILAMQMNVATPLIDDKLTGDELISVYYALFHGNIAYLRFGGFGLSSYLDASAPSDTTSLLYAYHQAVNRVWGKWFNAIQTLHANNELGGVIIDVRNNGGGSIGDYPFVLGALLPSGGYDSHYLRVKEGTGRLDFSPLVPFTLPTYSQQHAVITEQPIVILVNTHSVSMSEVTTWGVKCQENGYVIGTRTWGGLSALNDEPSMYSTTYSGGFGEQNVTPFFGYVPRFVSLFGEDKQILEGVGITPDKEVALDVNYWTSQKRDNQLEAALDYIHNK